MENSQFGGGYENFGGMEAFRCYLEAIGSPQMVAGCERRDGSVFEHCTNIGQSR